MDMLLDAILATGKARLAKPGEFSEQAFCLFFDCVFVGVSDVCWVPRRPTAFRIHPQTDLDVANRFLMVLELENLCF